MRKAALFWVFLMMFCIYLSGCTTHYPETPVDKDANSSDTSNLNSLSDSLSSEISDNIDSPVLNDNRTDRLYPDGYTFSTATESANRYMKIEKLHIPTEIMSYQVSLHGMVTKDTILVQLFSNNNDDSGELGFLRLKDNQYETLFEIKKDQYISILDWDNSRLVLQIGDADWLNVSLCYIDYQGKELHSSYKYSPETCQTAVIHNTVLLQGNNIYFGTIDSEKGDTFTELHQYEISTGKITMVASEAQIPSSIVGRW